MLRPRRFALLPVLSVLLLAGPLPSASAHAYLVGTGPEDGATLREAPRQIRLSFSEHVVLRATHLEVVDGDGRSVPVTRLHLVTSNPDDTERPSQIVGRLPQLPPSSYRVSWATLSSDDLHRTSGVFVFGVERQVRSAGFEEPVPGLWECALRWALLMGMALGLGGLLARSVTAAAGGSDQDLRRAGRLSLAGAGAALVASAALLAAQAVAGGASLGELLSGSYALRWGVRESGLVLLLLAASAALRGLPRSAVRLVLVAGAGLACTGTALVGHAGGGTPVSITRVLATGAHLAAALTWTGAVVCLAVLAHAREPRSSDDTTWRRVLRAFALPAAACVSVMVATGVYLSSDVVVSVDAALFTFYGRTLLMKIAVAGVAGLLALVNHRRLRGRHDLDLPRHTLVGEAVAVAAAVAATAMLTSAQPATAPQLVRSDEVVTRGQLDRQVEDLQETLRLRPNRPGRSVALVDVFDTRRPSPGPVTGVDVSVGRGEARAAELIPDGHWAADLLLRAPGRTVVTVSVHRAGLPDVRTGYAWTVGGAEARMQPVVVSKAPLAGPLRAGGGVLAAGVSAIWVMALLRRRRGGPGARGGPDGPESPGRHAAAPAAGLAADGGPGVSRAHSPMALAGVVLVLAAVGSSARPTVPGSGGRPAAVHRVQPAASVTAVATRTAQSPWLMQEPSHSATGEPARAQREALTSGGSPPGATRGTPVGLAAVPAVLSAAYRSAAAHAPSACRLPVPLLTAIGQVESGSLRGYPMDAEHRVHVFGPVLDGNGFAAIPDTDGGLWDGDASWDRAVGPMQFIPSTWRSFARDGDGDGTADPQDVEDAAAAAAAYLCYGGRDLGTAAGVRAAVLSYNHSEAYLSLVLGWMARFEASTVVEEATATSTASAPGTSRSPALRGGPFVATRHARRPSADRPTRAEGGRERRREHASGPVPDPPRHERPPQEPSVPGSSTDLPAGDVPPSIPGGDCAWQQPPPPVQEVDPGGLDPAEDTCTPWCASGGDTDAVPTGGTDAVPSSDTDVVPTGDTDAVPIRDDAADPAVARDPEVVAITGPPEQAACPSATPDPMWGQEDPLESLLPGTAAPD